MSRDKFDIGALDGLSRRALLQIAPVLFSLPIIAESTLAWAQDKLVGTGEVVVQNFGGSFAEAMRRAVHDPFTKATGIKVIDVVSDLAEPQVTAMFRAGKVDWDLADIQTSNYPAMHAAGMFVPIDYGLWDQEALQGIPPDARLESAVLRFSTGMTMAYDERAFPRGAPKNWTDFWDVRKFPGPRGLSASGARYNFVIALLADGVAHEDVWPLTEDKLDRAIKKLNEIKPHIAKWWSAGGEPVQLLINREYAMSSAADGRLLSAMRQGAPIKFTWQDALIINSPVSVILSGGANSMNAQKLIAFMSRAEISAAFTQAANFPAPNLNQMKYLPADLLPLFSINPQNAAKGVVQDNAWLAQTRADGKTNAAYLEERWLAWRAS
ncbi:ABC transporter substrate-binding protein [Bradyrhizobium elkanii]|uniref:ABC transporter substrate-binding protein n=1 Tax=Bradyrhizobium elkanii TaxID=29448 RepID=UPI001BA5EE10|nr:ABC transporter substrate-binding protein [Bradyrhizobium elkanii]MBR1165068.1 ABC transporter substrate-binding protein [Bradyrhizobium elkanii]